jgi:hypothetical protein
LIVFVLVVDVRVVVVVHSYKRVNQSQADRATVPGEALNRWQLPGAEYAKKAHVASAEHSCAHWSTVAIPVCRSMRCVFDTCLVPAVWVYPPLTPSAHVLSVAVAVVEVPVVLLVVNELVVDVADVVVEVPGAVTVVADVSVAVIEVAVVTVVVQASPRPSASPSI